MKGKILFVVGEEIRGVNPVIEFLKEKGLEVIIVYSNLEIPDIIQDNPDLILCITKIILKLADFDGKGKEVPDNLNLGSFPLTGLKAAEGIKGFSPDLLIWAVEIYDVRNKISNEDLEESGIERYFDFGNKNIYKDDNYFSLLDEIYSEIEKLKST